MNMKIHVIITLVALTRVVFPATAQMREEDAVKSVIDHLFAGMEKGDSAMVGNTFRSDVAFVTIFRDRQNNPRFERENSPDKFLDAVGTPHAEAWHEEIWNLSIRVDGDFAQAWCDYAFYLGDTFSHCGVDAFQLYREKTGWKIFQLTDTRRKEPCEIPDTIRRKHR